MKKLLFALTFLLSSLLCFSQDSVVHGKARDTLFLTDRLYRTTEDSFKIVDFNTTITLHIADTGVNHISIVPDKATDEPLNISIGQYVGSYTANDGFYFYYDATLESDKSYLLFCVKWNWNGTINSFGFKSPDGSLAAFYLKYTSTETSL